MRLDGLRIVVDCAHGAAYKVAPTVFWELGAEVFSLGVSPDGLNINRECGALSPEQMRREVLARRADIGIALDGDADRLIIADERGVILDGDQLMALIATCLARGDRYGWRLVATVMSNLGLERFWPGRASPCIVPRSATATSSRDARARLQLRRRAVGHIILSDYATTGDGLIAALQVLAAMVETGKRASEACWRLHPVPHSCAMCASGGQAARVARGAGRRSRRAKRGSAGGRLVIRQSGTEPVIRVMARARTKSSSASVVDEICDGDPAVARGTEEIAVPARHRRSGSERCSGMAMKAGC